MSIIVAAPKHRVTHPRGYRLHGITDGTHARPDEGFVKLGRTPGGWFRQRDWLADEQARRSREIELDHPEYVQRVVTLDCDEETLVVMPQKAPKSGKSSKAGKTAKSRKTGRLTNVIVDAWIRDSAPTFTGEITPTLRKMAREVISHQESVARYVTGN